jgi:fructose-specific phosphotransferase system component IIB
MKPVTVFVTYNPANEFEQTLAVRLHTIGAVHGFNMLMPDRHGSNGTINHETAYRIKSADYFILFSTSVLTPAVQQEVAAAFTHLKDKSKIVIIYNRVKNLQHNENCTEVYIDAAKNSPQEILDKVVLEIKKNQKLPKKKTSVRADDTTSVLGGILLIGLGLVALDSLFNTKK